MCRRSPIATVSSLPLMTSVKFGLSTRNVTLSGCCSASQTVTDVGVTLRNTGPASTCSCGSSVLARDSQGMTKQNPTGSSDGDKSWCGGDYAAVAGRVIGDVPTYSAVGRIVVVIFVAPW